MTEARIVEAIQNAYSFAEPDATIEQIREGYDRNMSRPGLAMSVKAETGTVAGVPGTWFIPEDVSTKTILFFHGGGYIFGSSTSHGAMVSRIAAAAQSESFLADFRLGPEYPYPAALDDGVTMLEELVKTRGADNVVVAGDSAGGGLVLATLIAAKDRGIVMPRAAVTLSAWSDLTQGSDSITSRAAIDPFVTREQLDHNSSHYLQGHDASDPFVSPALGDLSGFPELYLQVGSEEILFDDTIRVADKVIAAGGAATVDVQEGMPHVHQMLLNLLPEADEAIADIGAFIQHLS